MTKDIWFVRHGESVTNAGGIWLDQTTVPLTPTGHKQAQLASAALTEKPSLIITSPFIRTKETAGPTLNKWPDVKHEEWQVQEFCSICSERRGLLTSEEKEEIFSMARADPDYRDGETAESFNGLIQRVDNAIEHLTNRPENKIIMFSHGYFLSALFYCLSNRDLTPVSHMELEEYNKTRPIANTVIVNYKFHSGRDIELVSSSTAHLPEEDSSMQV
ncbi:MAG: histidine phosphatase family protein [Methyloligellaceae bacterium]